MLTNADVELQFAQKVTELVRELGILLQGYQCEVRLHRGDRKKRRDAEFKGNWDPDVDSIRILFSQVEEKIEAESGQVAASTNTVDTPSVEDRLSDLIRALDRAEGRPGYEFISLKWFRDAALAREGFAWAADEFARHDVLREAIDRRWVLTSKVANPRPPHFPVTAIRVNRQMPGANAVLGDRIGDLPAFHPVPIRGESLSATLLRDRR